MAQRLQSRPIWRLRARWFDPATYFTVFFTVASLFTVLSTSSAEAQPAFEVASIKLSPKGGLPMTVEPGFRNGMLHGERVTIRMLVAAAYGVTLPCVIGPGWLDSGRFDIVAKSPERVPDSAFKPMLQTLLKDRFKLVAHVSEQEMAVYFPGVAKGGVKMPIYPAHDTGPPGPSDRYRGAVMMRGAGTTSRLAQRMSNVVDRPVLDRTGLSDRYSYFLAFAPLAAQAGDSAPEPAQPDIFAAVKEQLGLTLRPGKGKVEVVIVDHSERTPTGN